MSTLDNILKNRVKKGIVTLPYKIEAVEKTGKEIQSLLANKFKRSFNLREVDTGSCGACEAEIIAANNPIYDLSRFGINFVASPRHADALLVTGPVSKNMRLALQKTYAAMPEPKLVITLGDCALDGGLFKESYYVEGGVRKILPVTLHIPGCPPTPLQIMQGILGLLTTNY